MPATMFRVTIEQTGTGSRPTRWNWRVKDWNGDYEVSGSGETYAEASRAVTAWVNANSSQEA